MSRLIIEAVSAEPKTQNVSVAGFLPQLHLLVSVSRAEDGAPVAGLKKGSFQISQPAAAITGAITVAAATELPSGSAATAGSGFYRLQLQLKQGSSVVFKENEPYAFGLRVVQTKAKGKALAQGQTAVRLISRDLKLMPGGKR